MGPQPDTILRAHPQRYAGWAAVDRQRMLCIRWGTDPLQPPDPFAQELGWLPQVDAGSAGGRPVVATLSILHEGYAAPTMDRVASTITLIQDGDSVIVVDPGMVADTRMILDPLSQLGVGVDMVTDIILSHHHPDHVINIGLFPNARVHDVMAIWYRDTLQIRPSEGFHVSESTMLIQTPGHTPQDVSTVVTTAAGIQVLTHLWWSAAGPADDPFSPDRAALFANRCRILDLHPARIIPGHGAAFAPRIDTPL